MAISGLSYRQKYISEDEQASLVDTVSQQPWLTDLKRRVQHYGYRYDYSRRNLDQSQYLGPLPPWIASLASRLHAEGIFSEIPNQVIINEYQPGQGISAHIDCVPCFGDTIVSISLLSPCVMIFSHPETQEQVPLLIEPRSLVVMQQDARYLWKHAILPRKTDFVDGEAIQRGRRISLTFRSVLPK